MLSLLMDFFPRWYLPLATELQHGGWRMIFCYKGTPRLSLKSLRKRVAVIVKCSSSTWWDLGLLCLWVYQPPISLILLIDMIRSAHYGWHHFPGQRIQDYIKMIESAENWHSLINSLFSALACGCNMSSCCKLFLPRLLCPGELYP